MTGPEESIRSEFASAITSGIRRRGPDAVGIVLVGVAKLLVAALAIAILLLASALSGYDMTAAHLAGATALIGTVHWLAAGRPKRPGR